MLVGLGLATASIGKNGGVIADSAPTNTVAPVVTGTNLVGYILSCTQGSWAGKPPITYTYQWKRDGVNIGATGNTYVVAVADVDHVVTCVVTATNSVGATSASSNEIHVYALPVNTALPTISGATTLGAVLTSTTGTWTGTAPITYAYQWERNGVPIAGEVASQHTIVSADQGEDLACRVTASNIAGSAAAVSGVWAIPGVDPNAPILWDNGFDTVPDPDELLVDADTAGPVYWMVTANASETSAAIEAGTGAEASGSFTATVGDNSEPVDLTGVAGGDWYLHLVQKVGGVYSNVLSSAFYLAAAGITFVGKQAASFLGTNSTKTVTIDLRDDANDPATRYENDLEILAFAFASTSDTNLSVSGFTEISDLYFNGSNDINLYVGYRWTAASPATTIVLPNTTSSTFSASWALHVLRGVNTTTPMTVSAVNVSGASPNFDRQIPGPITPDVSGAMIYIAAGGAVDAGAALTAGYLEHSAASHSTVGSTAQSEIIAGLVTWTSGTYTPAQVGGGQYVSGCSGAAVTLAFNPI